MGTYKIFDDFRFYPLDPFFPNELNKDDIIVLPSHCDPINQFRPFRKEAAKGYDFARNDF